MPRSSVDTEKLRRIKAVLFDKDGTLIDYHGTWGKANRDMALAVAGDNPVMAERLLHMGGVDEETGLALPGSILSSASNYEIAELWYPHSNGSFPSIEALEVFLNKGFQEVVTRHVSPVPGLEKTVTLLLETGLHLGVATSDSEAGAHATLDALGIKESFAFICGYDSGFGRKPEAGMVKGFCAHAGIAPEEVMVVGDNLHDIHMAIAAGAGVSVGVLTGTGTFEVLSQYADVVMDGVADIPAFLNI